jgi:flagellar hook-associated protein 1 FlgK
VGGLLTVRDQDIPQAIGSLDVLAYGIASGVNSANNAGSDLAGDVSGAGNIFAIPGTAAGSAAAISVVMTDPAHIAAAASGAGPGDASNAAVMAALGSSATIAGQTLTAYFSSLLSSIGSSVSAAQSVDTANQASLSQLTGQRNALSETNLNDEASAISDLERSYQAASKVFSILNQVLASALNLGTPTTVS